jgi:GTPase SAR1 family protein
MNLEKYLKWSDALVLVYSITCNQSFSLIQDYLEQLFELSKKMADDSTEKNEKASVKIFLLGNKVDLERHR